MAKRRIDPEERARWIDARRRLEQSIERSERRLAERRAAGALRRARLRRLTFGLLGRRAA
jgi:hypothetical protein